MKAQCKIQNEKLKIPDRRVAPNGMRPGVESPGVRGDCHVSQIANLRHSGVPLRATGAPASGTAFRALSPLLNFEFLTFN